MCARACVVVVSLDWLDMVWGSPGRGCGGGTDACRINYDTPFNKLPPAMQAVFNDLKCVATRAQACAARTCVCVCRVKRCRADPPCATPACACVARCCSTRIHETDNYQKVLKRHSTVPLKELKATLVEVRQVRTRTTTQDSAAAAAFATRCGADCASPVCPLPHSFCHGVVARQSVSALRNSLQQKNNAIQTVQRRVERDQHHADMAHLKCVAATAARALDRVSAPPPLAPAHTSRHARAHAHTRTPSLLQRPRLCVRLCARGAAAQRVLLAALGSV